MIYLIYGEQEAIIAQEVKKIVKDSLEVIDDFSYIRYNLDETLLQDIIADAETMPFGIDKKVISVKNSYIFGQTSGKKEKLEHDLDSLINYVNHENPATVLVFSLCAPKLNEKAKVYQAIKDKIQVKRTVDVGKEQWDVAIKRMINNRGLNFENKALEEFINRTKGDLSQVGRELDKLKTYGGKITFDVVDKLIARPLEENMFGIVDAILSGHPETALAIYNDLRAQNEDPSTLLVALAVQFCFLYKVKYLEEQGKQENEICSELGVSNPYRVRISLRKTRNISSTDILALLSELADLDFKTKSGQIDRFQAFELFLVMEH